MLSRAAASDPAPARLGEETGPAAPRLGEGPAGCGHEVQRADRARDVSPAGAYPRQAKGCGGDVVGVGASADHVERLGDVGLTAGLAGKREGQLGASSPGTWP